jgi:hypothetical protein
MAKSRILSKLQALPKSIRIILFFGINLLVMFGLSSIFNTGATETNGGGTNTTMWIISSLFIAVFYTIFFPKKKN